MYLFGIVGVLIITDIVLLIPPTAVPSARLRREQEEFEGNKVSVLFILHIMLTVCSIYSIA